MKQKQEMEPEVLEEIIKSIRQIEYGEIVITIHDSKMVQLEKREKRRFIHKEEVMGSGMVKKKK